MIKLNVLKKRDSSGLHRWPLNIITSVPMSREAEGDLTTKEEEGDYQGKQRFEDTLQLVLKMGTGES